MNVTCRIYALKYFDFIFKLIIRLSPISFLRMCSKSLYLEINRCPNISTIIKAIKVKARQTINSISIRYAMKK
jgi:hypothetical protein